MSIALVSAVFWCQPFSGFSVSPVPTFSWCQLFCGASFTPVPALFWCQLLCGTRFTLVPAFLRCQHFSGASILPVLRIVCVSMESALVAALSGTSHFPVLELMEMVLGKKHTSILTSMSNLAEVLGAQ